MLLLTKYICFEIVFIAWYRTYFACIDVLVVQTLLSSSSGGSSSIGGSGSSSSNSSSNSSSSSSNSNSSSSGSSNSSGSSSSSNSSGLCTDSLHKHPLLYCRMPTTIVNNSNNTILQDCLITELILGTW
jgi:hypothetical protein